MCDIPIGLDGVEKILRRDFVPSLQSLLFRKMVEGIVDFDGIEILGVILEPFALGQIGWIEPPAPVVVIPPGRSDSNIAVGFIHTLYCNTFNSSWNCSNTKKSSETGEKPDYSIDIRFKTDIVYSKLCFKEK